MKLERVGKGTSSYIDRNDILSQIVNLFDLSLIRKIFFNDSPNRTREVQCSENYQFWKNAIQSNYYPEQVICLNNFKILEWLPFSPGLFFTDEAINSRNLALNEARVGSISLKMLGAYGDKIPRNYIELPPSGKGQMIKGGIGSIRLTSKIFKNEEKYFLCASSNGVSHEGIPMVISANEYSKVIDKIKTESRFDIRFSICGKLKMLPVEFSSFKFSRGIPKYYLDVDSIYPEHNQSSPLNMSTNQIVSVAIMYGVDNDMRYDSKWSFCQFTPDSQDKQLNVAVNWLKDYAFRYSENKEPIIIGDFDEQKEHFDNVEFPISKIINGDYNPEIVQSYFKRNHINLTLNMGDVFKNISNTTIVNRSLLHSSFVKAESSVGFDKANVLNEIASIVEETKSKDAGELFDSFNEELAKPQPKNTVLKSIWKGMTEAAPLLLTTAEIVEKVKPLLGL
ncbi:hypothetical protein [Spirosoma endophyticum]|uniref:Uncharacterized protein n=1 Tax=Spirosoma endophyticum TaxID=662367 RepID=A0A1I1ZD62_9BACT|nr:hypothetical protein [Spirosoma endophyticum]SFE29649.1 hypothetical protein SAMN05216167_11286 [Spirosoma endophyticum]